MTKLTLDLVNRQSRAEFVQSLGGIFEHSPWVAEQVFALRPFGSVADLHQAMVAVIAAADQSVKMQLIRNHPELAGRAAIAGELTAESTSEQKGAGLDQCSPQELAELTELNRAYAERFGMPFIIAVSGLNRRNILDAVAARLHNSESAEQQEAMNQIYRIGLIRLNKLLG
ncbi:MAG: 2-oxo-4-hydroxy-4-carboxy-5-ureidoimidazoline decarboxylase [Candidatus Pacebacteria bacterium]|nr:2-oxo-4-hydroxy-4-carboxy-5-ureidoimidazoline decarboxylase [Candidatus Paceibacterota bacterium]